MGVYQWGSTGLGFDLARKAAMLDANVAIIGRDEGDYKVPHKDYRNVGKVKLLLSPSICRRIF